MTNDDDGKSDRPKLHIGDLGTILLAGVFLVGMLFMIFGPSPFDGVFKKQPEAKPAEKGEVTITLPAKN
ncbi:MAG: hypothetical protein P4L57_02135 [Rhizomicrobium sp.]|nr:hypothetical protein [Rhizomicrobium sp.]